MVPSCDLCTAPAHGIDHSWFLPLLPHLPAPPAWPCLLTLPHLGTAGARHPPVLQQLGQQGAPQVQAGWDARAHLSGE